MGDTIIDLKKFVSNSLIAKGGEDFELCPEKYEYIGIYFSAHWCPPCRGFTPLLKTFYEKDENAKGKLEIIFCSLDKDNDAFNDYFAEMPWKAIKYDNEDLKTYLTGKCGVSGIPNFTIIDKEGKIVTTDGRKWVTDGSSVDLWKHKIGQK